MSQHKIPYSKFQQAYKNRVKVFLDVPRIQPRQDDDIFDDVVQISDDGNLSTRPMKTSPHFDANRILLYTKANEDVSKFLSTIKSKEQCEQLRALLALDIGYLNGCVVPPPAAGGRLRPRSLCIKMRLYLHLSCYLGVLKVGQTGDPNRGEEQS